MRFHSAQQWVRSFVLCGGIPIALSAQSVVRASIAGTVYDSVTRRTLSGAMVRIVRANDPSIGRSTTTDALGGFAYDSVPAGVWLASFLHPSLDSLRLEPGVVRIDINESGTITLPLTIPSARTLIAINCRGPIAGDLGVIVGEVHRASDDAAIVGATVEVSWPEWLLQKGRMVTDQRARRRNRERQRDGTGLVYVDAHNARLKPQRVERRMQKRCEPHACRHTVIRKAAECVSGRAAAD